MPEPGAAPPEDLVYRCVPTVAWVRELDHTRLLDLERRKSWRLDGLEASVWDLLVLGYAHRQVLAFLVAFLGITAEQSQARLLAMLGGWHEAGLLTVERQPRQAGGATWSTSPLLLSVSSVAPTASPSST